jgi:hypothetical protein
MTNKFQAIINNIVQDPDATVVEVLFTDNISQKILKEYRLTSFDLNSFKRTIQAQIDQLATTQTAATSLTTGPFDTTITPPSPTTLQLYQQDVTLLNQYQRAINLGVITTADTGYQAQLKKVQQGYDVSLISAF